MSHRRAICIIQARMGSTRLPGKVLCHLAGRPMLERVIRRLRRVTSLDQIVVATSDLPQDRVLVEHCAEQGIDCFAGDHEDVLRRYARAARAYSADLIVRVTADCPLIDPQVVDRTLRLFHFDPSLDCACNVFPQRTFPRGLDVEVITRSLLDRLDRTIHDARVREHVTLAIYQSPQQFRIGSVRNEQDYSDLRWTVDEPADLALVQEIYALFGERAFTWRDVLSAYGSNPQWRSMNSHIVQKAA